MQKGNIVGINHVCIHTTLTILLESDVICEHIYNIQINTYT